MKAVRIGAALIAAQFVAPALADAGQKRRDVHVEVADIDMSRAEGIAELDRRIARAVLKACGTAYYLDPVQLADMERCRADASSRAFAARQALLAAGMGSAVSAARASK